jgi:hypothetical protein
MIQYAWSQMREFPFTWQASDGYSVRPMLKAAEVSLGSDSRVSTTIRLIRGEGEKGTRIPKCCRNPVIAAKNPAAAV